MTDHTDRLFELALAMAQDLREYADSAAECGTPIEATEQLLAEFDAWVKTMDQEAHEESYDKPLPGWAARALGEATP